MHNLFYFLSEQTGNLLVSLIRRMQTVIGIIRSLGRIRIFIIFIINLYANIIGISKLPVSIRGFHPFKPHGSLRRKAGEAVQIQDRNPRIPAGVQNAFRFMSISFSASQSFP